MVDLTIEPAKSARSACKTCRVKIEKGEVRVGVTTTIGDYDQTAWIHVACFAKGKHAASKDLEDIDGYNSLSSAEKAAAKKDFAAASKASKGGAAAKTAAKGKKGAAAAAASSSSESEPESDPSDSESDGGKGKKGAKKGAKGTATSAKSSGGSGGALAGYTASERETYKKKLEDALELSVAQLKDALKKNGMTQTGNKSEIAARLADCQTLGTLPNCTKCGGGRLKFDQKAGTYFCKGYMDDADYVNCSAKFQKSEVTRGTWTD